MHIPVRSLPYSVIFFAALTAASLLIALSPPHLLPVRTGGIDRTIMNVSGQAIAVNPPVKRVIIYAPVLWDYLTVNEGAAGILAVANYMCREIELSPLGRIYPDSLALPVALTEGQNSAIPGDLEEILRLRPDAVVSWRWFADPLKKVGLPVVEIEGIETEEKLLNVYRLAAAVTDREERGEWLILRYFGKCGEIARKVAGLGALKKPTALSLTITALNSIYAVNQDTPHSRALHAAGGRNLARDYKSSVIDAEQLLWLNPDVIFLDGTSGAARGPKFMYDQLQWQTLSAVRNRRVYTQPMGNARMWGPVEEPLLQLWMAELLYPNEMTKTFRKEFKAAYQEVYHYSLSDDEIDRNIFLDANRLSAGYDRFMREGSFR
jgi:iron complex transport system substrate-binding protein